MTNEELVADGLLGIDEVMAFTGLSRSAIYQMMESGRLPFAKLGKRRLVPRLALVEMVSRAVVRRDPAAA